MKYGNDSTSKRCTSNRIHDTAENARITDGQHFEDRRDKRKGKGRKRTQKKPLKVMITSFGEYVKKGSNKGMRMRATDSKAMAQHMPNNVT